VSEIRRHLGERRFDFIIFSHILEHLYDPLAAINNYLPFLKDSGRLIVSVPNVAVWSNRIKFLFGGFTYKDTGIMDKTHVRFFTLRSATALLRASGCSIVRVDYTPYFTRALLPLIKRIFRLDSSNRCDDRRKILDSRPYKWYLRYIYPVEHCLGYLRKPLFAYDFIIVAKKEIGACPSNGPYRGPSASRLRAAQGARPKAYPK
jgi:SAM-dependent methyltransferase